MHLMHCGPVDDLSGEVGTYWRKRGESDIWIQKAAEIEFYDLSHNRANPKASNASEIPGKCLALRYTQVQTLLNRPVRPGV
jgi:hypothetical protein